MGFSSNIAAMWTSMSAEFGEIVTYDSADGLTSEDVTAIITEHNDIYDVRSDLALGGMAEQNTGEVMFDSAGITSPSANDSITRSDGSVWYFLRELTRKGTTVEWLIRSDQTKRAYL